jgi:hypothetical protein
MAASTCRRPRCGNGFHRRPTVDVPARSVIAGDATHRMRQRLGSSLAAARGFPASCHRAARDPDSDDNWFITDWMDTTRAQQAPSSASLLPDMLAEIAAQPAGNATPWCRTVGPGIVSGSAPTARSGNLRRSVGGAQRPAR